LFDRIDLICRSKLTFSCPLAIAGSSTSPEKRKRMSIKRPRDCPTMDASLLSWMVISRWDEDPEMQSTTASAGASFSF
jgi:hypothetical protein